MKIKSIWMNEYKRTSKREKKNLNDTDILIIGGGITGLSCAYFLKDSNYQITLLDKGKIGMGITSKTTAKINYLQGTIYQDLEIFFSSFVKIKASTFSKSHLISSFFTMDSI